MKKTITTVVLVLSLAMNIGVGVKILYHRAAIKHLWTKGPAAMRGVPRMPFYRKLDLAKEQEEKITKLHEEMQKKILPLGKSLNEKRRELFAMVKSGKIDQDKKQKLLQEITGLQMQIESITLDNMINVRNVMTPQQLKKMNRSFEKMEPRFFGGDTFPVPHMHGMRKFGK